MFPSFLYLYWRVKTLKKSHWTRWPIFHCHDQIVFCVFFSKNPGWKTDDPFSNDMGSTKDLQKKTKKNMGSTKDLQKKTKKNMGSTKDLPPKNKWCPMKSSDLSMAFPFPQRFSWSGRFARFCQVVSACFHQPIIVQAMTCAWYGPRLGWLGWLKHRNQVSGWWARATPLKNMKVNWDDDYSQVIWKNKIHGNQTTNQV